MHEPFEKKRDFPASYVIVYQRVTLSKCLRRSSETYGCLLHNWLVLNPHLVAHLLVISWGKWSSIAHLLVTKHSSDKMFKLQPPRYLFLVSGAEKCQTRLEDFFFVQVEWRIQVAQWKHHGLMEAKRLVDLWGKCWGPLGMVQGIIGCTPTNVPLLEIPI